MLDPKWARTSLHKPESASVTAANSKTSRLQSSEPSGKDEGKKLRSARKRRIPSRSRRGEEFEWVLQVSTLSTLSETQGNSFSDHRSSLFCSRLKESRDGGRGGGQVNYS
ncbi:hypothetical protein FF2_045274 [Malus domestica]